MRRTTAQAGLNAAFVDAAPVAIAVCQGRFHNKLEQVWLTTAGNAAAIIQVQTISSHDNTAPTTKAPNTQI
jgi:hypothetical protein